MSRQTRVAVEQLVDELSEAAGRIGLEVRRERILREIGYRARGGACCLRGKNLVILDRARPTSEQLELLGEVLRKRDLETLYLSPAARRIVEPAASQT